KTAIGATESVTWEHVKSTTELVERLKKDGYQIIGVEQAEQSVMLNEFSMDVFNVWIGMPCAQSVSFARYW
ncbi:MAG: hypothetical protein AB8G22_10030, partial [Saprospiraceae bacterium]